MRISELAERVGVLATTLRFYETAGLLAPERTAAGYRVYDEDAVDRLGFIRAAKHLGLPLDEVGELLAVWQTGACVDVKGDLRQRLVGRLADAEVPAAELASFITTLQLAQHRLDTLPGPDRPPRPRLRLPQPASLARRRGTAAGRSRAWGRGEVAERTGRSLPGRLLQHHVQ